MAHNRRKNRLVDVYEPERRDEMLEAFWAATDESDVEAWFSEPWRDGRNAARLCLALEPQPHREDAARTWLVGVIDKPHEQLTSEDYAVAEDLRYLVSRENATRCGVLLDAALAIYGNWIARSDGGGVVPNVHLSAALGRLLYSGELAMDQVGEAVGQWRARDVGLDWTRIGDGSPRAGDAATHRWLWLNRRYAMAYALGRAR